MQTREERDTMGVVELPAEALWGAQTQRSLQNFRISSECMPVNKSVGLDSFFWGIFVARTMVSTKGNDMMEHSNSFIDSAELTKWTKWFLYLQVGINAIAVISGVLEYQLLDDLKNGIYTFQDEAIAAAEVNDSRQLVIVSTQLLVLLVSGILILKWIYRANYNARQLGASGMRFTPGWSIGWYFIPVVSLWKPYQAMKEIWKASSNPQEWRSQSVPSILTWWWFFWIVSNLFGYASFRIALNAEQINELIVANATNLFSNIIGIPLSFIMLAIVNKVYEMQVSHFDEVTTNANP